MLTLHCRRHFKWWWWIDDDDDDDNDGLMILTIINHARTLGSIAIYREFVTSAKKIREF